MLFRRSMRVSSARVHSASRETRSCCAICRVDLDLFAGLGVFQRNDADVRQHLLAFIMNVDRQ